MANHKSKLNELDQTIKKIVKPFSNKTTRNAIKKLKGLTSQKEAKKLLPVVTSLIDKLSKKNIVHKNKAANLKSKLTKHVISLK